MPCWLGERPPAETAAHDPLTRRHHTATPPPHHAKQHHQVFLGTLREIELERVREKLSSAIMETCLALTIFREEFNMGFVGMFTLLTFVKVGGWWRGGCSCAHWLASGGVAGPTPTTLSSTPAHTSSTASQTSATAGVPLAGGGPRGLHRGHTQRVTPRTRAHRRLPHRAPGACACAGGLCLRVLYGSSLCSV